ncbi:MAG: ADP-ribosyltransferase [Eubacteriales bacterium]|nr:ADP-ribosyltransferase [Eubacteriales bacterium]
MQISTKAWVQYITKMAKISQKAADLMQAYVQKHGFDDDKALLDYAFALSQRYGQAIGSLSCSMYEATAAAQGVTVPTAEIADLPEYGEVAKAVHGTMKRSQISVPSTVARLVKQVGADTTLKNAMRDGAQFAWVPHGDTCSFCITLASRGWQYMSKKALKNGHAEHIHANCDCQYAVRFDGKSGVGGYDPDEYLAQYNAAGGDINAMRRMRYKENKDAINARKRELYANKKVGNIKIGELSVKEKAAIIRYISPDAYVLNDKLRRGVETELTDMEKEWIKDLDMAIEKLPNYEGGLNRSITIVFEEDAQKFFDEFHKGKEYIANQYLSTTKSGVYNEDAQVQIYIQNAKNGKDLGKFNDMENEVLYPYGTKFEVVNKIEKDGRFYILLEEKA